MKKRLLVLPGSYWAGSAAIRPTYDAVIEEAESMGFKVILVTYPGQGSNAAYFSYPGALAVAREASHEFRPTHILAFSVGCYVAARLMEDPLVIQTCKQWTLWGAYCSLEPWESEEAKRIAIALHRRADTFVAPDYFQTHPMELEVNPVSPALVRVVRGENDVSSTDAELRAIVERLRKSGVDAEFRAAAEFGHMPIQSGGANLREFAKTLLACWGN